MRRDLDHTINVVSRLKQRLVIVERKMTVKKRYPESICCIVLDQDVPKRLENCAIAFVERNNLIRQREGLIVIRHDVHLMQP